MRYFLASLFLVALSPSSALACPVCGLAGVRDNWAAYGIMSVILSLLPLGMITGITVWLARRVRAAEASGAAAVLSGRRPDVTDAGAGLRRPSCSEGPAYLKSS